MNVEYRIKILDARNELADYEKLAAWRLGILTSNLQYQVLLLLLVLSVYDFKPPNIP